ncbi:hypothetical protein D3C73_1480740 [compost metagenome]
MLASVLAGTFSLAAGVVDTSVLVPQPVAITVSAVARAKTDINLRFICNSP